jgi:hypothetical protein
MPAIYIPSGATAKPFQIAAGASTPSGSIILDFGSVTGEQIFVNFVVFGVKPSNAVGPTPQALGVAAGLAGNPASTLSLTLDVGYLEIPGTKYSVKYSEHPSGAAGVYQLIFDPGPNDLSNTKWSLQFSNPDAVNAVQLTIAQDTADTVLPWIGFPLNGATDFAAASTLTPLTDGATPPFTSQVQLLTGQTYQLSVPIYNYGTGPMTITIPAAITSGAFSLQPKTVTIPPGSGDTLSVTLAAQTASGQVNTSASPAVLAVTNPDTVHPGSLAFYATVGAMEFVFALDVSGSMATIDYPMDNSTRWQKLQGAVSLLMAQLQKFAGGGSWGAVLYPDPAGPQSKVIQARTAITASSSLDLSYTPTNGTPMVAGIVAAAGDPAQSPTTSLGCGLFVPFGSTAANQAAFQYDHRWLILMTDGAANIGGDPSTVFTPKYYAPGIVNGLPVGRNVKAATIGFGTGGQTDPAVLQAIATNSNGQYFPADAATGDPSQGLVQQFLKAVTAGLALNFSADPSATLPAAEGAANAHNVIISNYDKKASFVLAFLTELECRSVTFSLIAPSGDKINPRDAATFGLVFDEGALSQSYFLDLGAAKGLGNLHGAWTLVVAFTRFFNAGVADTAPARFETNIRYAYSAIVDSRLTLHLGVGNKAIYAGDTIELSAALAVDGLPVSDASAKALFTGSGVGFDNWLASQYLSDADYNAELTALGAMHDIQSQYVKTLALEKKGISFPGAPAVATRALTANPRTGAYEAKFDPIAKPGTYQILVTALGQDSSGNLFQRQKSQQIVIQVQPTETGTLVDISYQVDAGRMVAILRFWPRDDHGNVFLVDPAISSAIKVLVAGGATLSGSLVDNRDGSYTQRFTYPLSALPVVRIDIGGKPVIPKLLTPDFDGLVFVSAVVEVDAGREASPGANVHADAKLALGDPSKKPVRDFFSLGGRGSGAFTTQTHPIDAHEVTVFVALDSSLRPYAVEVLPARPGAKWVEVGRSKGVSQTFGLIPKKSVLPDPKDWFIEVEGRVAGETFDVRIPLAGKLHAPKDPLTEIGGDGIAAVRVIDLSNIVLDPDGSPSHSPGVSIAGIGFTL